jgi:predicted PurR-regulated permease PerM
MGPMTQRELVGRTATVLALVILAWGLVWFIRQITDILILLLVSAIFAAGFAPLVGVVEAWRLPRGIRVSRGAAIFILYLGIFAVVILILSMVIFPAVREAAGFAQQLPQLLALVKQWLVDQRAHWPWLPDLAGMLDGLPSQITRLAQLGPEAAGVAFRFLSGVGAVITVLVFTFYMLLQGAAIKHACLALFPPKERPRVTLVLERIGRKFGGWLRGQLLLSFAVAVPVAVVLRIIGMPYPLVLGMIAGIGELIPMVGPTLGAAVAILVALSQTSWQLVAVVIFYVILLNVEPHILVPRIMSHAIGLSPLLTLVALLTGIKLIGILGGLLSIPVAAALQVIVGELVREIEPGADSAAPGPRP